MTKEEAIRELGAIGVVLDQKDVDELASAADSDVQRVVGEWIELVEMCPPFVVLDDLLRVMKQVPEWVDLAARILALVFRLGA